MNHTDWVSISLLLTIRTMASFPICLLASVTASFVVVVVVFSFPLFQDTGLRPSVKSQRKFPLGEPPRQDDGRGQAGVRAPSFRRREWRRRRRPSQSLLSGWGALRRGGG